ncbi:hypothetical protein VSR01_10550 [Actinacidiphila sp. DG2A-62]|uniref:hypothetical protein n=1 Tax=Actinacidiphila sp. DG2A-62 TaxID=3108821 RepID=UPI002DBB242F|nr:hypothetical protein [Actinacidiphila sp. DG2A-62]MEC3993957.1 hypothetical protein [Actinacidiphila sp. DG2A-62]
MNTNRSPQTGPATALAQLLSEHPELPPIRWSLCPDGLLMGSAMRLETDARPVMAEFVAVLGGAPVEATSSSVQGDLIFSSWLHTTWRDVPLSVTLGCAAELASAPVGLPVAWSAGAA